MSVAAIYIGPVLLPGLAHTHRHYYCCCVIYLCTTVLRGTTVKRTYGILENLYGVYLTIFTKNIRSCWLWSSVKVSWCTRVIACGPMRVLSADKNVGRVVRKTSGLPSLVVSGEAFCSLCEGAISRSSNEAPHPYEQGHCSILRSTYVCSLTL